MKFLLWILPLCAAQVYAATPSQLKDVKSVYFYPMPSGFEQHLANRIASEHVFQVVSDPKLADAVFTDQLTEAFLYKLDHIQPPVPPALPATAPAPNTAAAARAVQEPHTSSFSRGKGTIFLVDAKTKQVLWSIFQKPKNSSPGELNRTAKRVVEKLEVSTGMKPETH